MQMEIKKAIVTIFISEKTDFKTKAVARVQGGFSDSTSGYLSKKTQDTNSERPAYPYDRHSITTAKMRRRPERPLRDAWVKMTGAYILGRPKRPFSFFCKIKDTVFIFTSNFTDLDILSMSATSHYWLLVGRGQGASQHSPVRKSAPQQRMIWLKCQ